MRMEPSRVCAGLAVLLAAGALPPPAAAETVHGRVTFVGTLGEERQPDGALHARFRFRLSESGCGTYDGLWTKTWNTTNWTSWQQLSPAPIASDPAAVWRGSGSMGVFALGTDGRMYTMGWDGTRWSGWTSMGNELFTSGPAVVSSTPSRVDLFALGMSDSALWTNTWTGTWSGWRQVTPQPMNSAPAAVASGPNRIDVFARGALNAMYTLVIDGTSAPSWTSMGGVFTSGPGAASWGPGRLDVFGRGTDDALWTNASSGAGWSGWRQVSPQPITSAPSAISVSSNRIDVYARGPNNQVQTIVWDGAQWSGWTSLGTDRLGSGAAATATGNRVDLFARGSARFDRWFHTTSGRMDGAFQHNGPNFRNAYNTLLSGLLARSVTNVQVDGVPSCDETQVQTLALERAQIGLYP